MITTRTRMSRIGLRERAALSVASLCVVSVLAVSIHNVIGTNRMLIRNQQAAVQGVGSGLVAAIELPLAVHDRREIGHVLDRFLTLLPDGEFIIVLDDKGGRMGEACNDETLLRAYLNGEKNIEGVQITQFRVVAPPNHDADLGMLGFRDEPTPEEAEPTQQQTAATGETLGRVVAGISTESLSSAKLAQWKSMGGTLAVLTAVTLPVIYLLVGGWTSRLRRLTDSAMRITDGDYTTPLRDGGNDEIATLAEAYEHMRCAIKLRKEQEQRRQRELSAAREEADLANTAKSQFLAHMSHEIRTPINGVTGMLELLSMTSLSERQRRHIHTAMSSADALLCLISDILDFSKIEAGQMQAERIVTDTREIFDGVAEMLACRAAEKGVELIFDIPRAVPRFIISDPTKVRQIVINLVSNAIKFTEEGEVVVRVRAEKDSKGGWVLRVSVTDTGIGIPYEQRGRLFESFSQLDASTTRRYGGSGLGLAICKGFVDLLDGQIGLNAQRAEGSEFWFTFAAGFCQQDDEPVPLFHGKLRSMRALIVDDNRTNREIYAEALSAWGLRAESCASGAHALQTLRQAPGDDPFRLVILDMQMPEMDGVMVAESVRDDERIETPIMIMLSSMYQLLDLEEQRTLSLAACLQKPVRLSHLHDALAMHVMGSRNHDDAPDTSRGRYEETLAGVRALVAEDNAVNQLVIEELLRSVGVDVKLVEDGVQAVNEVYAQRYDFILMDCAMPQMDGFEATRWIRKFEKADPEVGRIPIIALTANAIQGDRERCIDAGMNDYLTKPVEARKLFRTLAKWVRDEQNRDGPRREEAHAPPTPQRSDQPATPATPPPPPNHERIIDLDAALQRCAHSFAVLVRVLDEFVRLYDGVESHMRELVGSESYEELERLTHGLKGAAANIGADVLSKQAFTLEVAARRQMPEGMNESVRAIGDSMNSVRCEIDWYRADLLDAA